MRVVSGAVPPPDKRSGIVRRWVRRWAASGRQAGGAALGSLIPARPATITALIGVDRPCVIRPLLVLDHRQRVDPREPAVQVDVRAALRAKRPELLDRELAADRARFEAGSWRRIGHAVNVGIAGQK